MATAVRRLSRLAILLQLFGFLGPRAEFLQAQRQPGPAFASTTVRLRTQPSVDATVRAVTNWGRRRGPALRFSLVSRPVQASGRLRSGAVPCRHRPLRHANGRTRLLELERHLGPVAKPHVGRPCSAGGHGAMPRWYIQLQPVPSRDLLPSRGRSPLAAVTSSPPNPRLLLPGRGGLSRRRISLLWVICGGFGTPRSRSAGR